MRIATITEEQYREGNETGIGICRFCHAQQGCVEPDAEGVKCEDCGKPGVAGLEQALVCGWLDIEGGAAI